MPAGTDEDFDREERGEDCDIVCAIRVLSLQAKSTDSSLLRKDSERDPVISTVMRYVREGWPHNDASNDPDVENFRKISGSLSVHHGCLVYGSRVVIPEVMRSTILELLHRGQFGM